MYSHSAQQGKGNSWCSGDFKPSEWLGFRKFKLLRCKMSDFHEEKQHEQALPFRCSLLTENSKSFAHASYHSIQFLMMPHGLPEKFFFSSTYIDLFVATSGCHIVFSCALPGPPPNPLTLQFPRFGNRTPIFRTAPRCAWRFWICCCPFSCSAGMSLAFTGHGLAARPAFRCWCVRKKGRQSLMPSWHLPSWTLHSLCLGAKYLDCGRVWRFSLTRFTSWFKSAIILGVKLWFALQSSRNLSPQPINFNQFLVHPIPFWPIHFLESYRRIRIFIPKTSSLLEINLPSPRNFICEMISTRNCPKRIQKSTDELVHTI